MARQSARAALVLNDEQRVMLRERAGSRTAAQREVERAKVLLAYADGKSPTEIQRALGVSRPTIYKCIERVFWDAGWTDAGQGWEGKGEGKDGQLRLCGWKHNRRVVVLRRPLKGEVLLAQADDAQGLLGFVEADRKAGKRTTGYEYAVLVSNLKHEILALRQLYRDRADAENAFDELKNQWGWGGFTTHDLHRCQLSARAVALIYNWWSLFVRLASPEARREAITSRPWLMSSIGRKTEHAGQTTITLTGLHAHFGKARESLMRISSMLKAWTERAAEQLNARTVWQFVCDYLKLILAGIRPPNSSRLLANHAYGAG